MEALRDLLLQEGAWGFLDGGDRDGIRYCISGLSRDLDIVK